MEVDELIIELDESDEYVDTDYPCLIKYTGSFDELFKSYNHHATINDSMETKRMVYHKCMPQVSLMGANGKIWSKSMELVIHHIDVTTNDQYFVGYSLAFPWAKIKSQFQKLFTKIIGMIDNTRWQNNLSTHQIATTFTDLINQLKQYQKRYGLTFHITPVGNK